MVAFLITLSLIILVHELGHFFMARWVGVKVERFSIGFGPRLIKFTPGATEYTLSLLPFGGYVKMAGEAHQGGPIRSWEFRARSVGERMGIVLAGPGINYLLGFFLFVLIFLVGAPVLSSRIGKVLEGYPAEAAGLKAQDKILKINGKEVTRWEEVTQSIHSETSTIRLTIDRGGQILEIPVTPRIQEVTNLLGVRVRIGMVGIVPGEEIFIQRHPFPQAMMEATRRVWNLTKLTLQAIFRIVTGGLSIRESVTGPIGIFYLTSAIAEQGWISLLQLIAVLSTSLGLFNLLPIPVLDGGHLAFLTLEKLRGQPISLKAQEVMTRVGLGLLVSLLLVVTYNDLVKFKVFDRILPFLRP